MKMKHYSVTNNSGYAIRIVGRQRVSIPKECKGYEITLAAGTADAVITSLKRKFPALKVTELDEEPNKPSCATITSDTKGVLINADPMHTRVTVKGVELTAGLPGFKGPSDADKCYLVTCVNAPEWYGKDNGKDTAMFRSHFYGKELGNPGLFWNDKDSKDDDKSHYMYLYRSMDAEKLKALSSGEVLEDYTEFDWDGDGNYEQRVTFEIYPAEITLKKADGTVEWPLNAAKYGNVASTTDGATVYKSNPTKVKVIVKDVTLKFEQPEGWLTNGDDKMYCVMTKVEAPAGLTEEQLKNAKYRNSKEANKEEVNAEGSFWDDKDSEESFSKHFMYVGQSLSKEKLEKAEAGKKYVTFTEFDWDGDGTFEQRVTFETDPAEVTLKNEGNVEWPTSVIGPISTVTQLKAVAATKSTKKSRK